MKLVAGGDRPIESDRIGSVIPGRPFLELVCTFDIFRRKCSTADHEERKDGEDAQEREPHLSEAIESWCVRIWFRHGDNKEEQLTRNGGRWLEQGNDESGLRSGKHWAGISAHYVFCSSNGQNEDQLCLMAKSRKESEQHNIMLITLKRRCPDLDPPHWSPDPPVMFEYSCIAVSTVMISLQVSRFSGFINLLHGASRICNRDWHLHPKHRHSAIFGSGASFSPDSFAEAEGVRDIVTRRLFDCWYLSSWFVIRTKPDTLGWKTCSSGAAVRR